MNTPLADRMRPKDLTEVVGQQHILAPGKVLFNIIESGKIPNMIFYGSSGIGKTTVARIIAERSGMRLHKLNGTTCSTADIKEVFAESDTLLGRGGILLYLDEIQYLNKRQQQSLLEYIENGTVTLIASTTENPYFYIYNAILSRCTVFEFKSVSPEEILPAVERAFAQMEQELEEPIVREDGVDTLIARGCGGDVRKALNAVELCCLSAQHEEDRRLVSLEAAQEVSQKSAMKYDRSGDEHYDILSALQKSVRGSDENAALHYLARILEAGDLISACRRLLVMASEDVGLAYPMAAVIVKSCVDSALQLGLPEARIPLAEAVVLMCTAPKSNSAYLGINAAMQDIQAGINGPIPRNLQNKHYDSAEVEVKGQFYQYPHDFPGHWVPQQYLPDVLKDRVYYQFGDNKNEQAALAYRQSVRKLHEKK